MAMVDRDRLQQAFTAIDARNAADPNTITVDGVTRSKELAHAAMMVDWVRRLCPDPGEALLLAARAHHIRRWVIPRGSFPEGRVGYLQWRNRLKEMHAAELRGILESQGYDAALIERACDILRKRDLTRDPEVQVLEDALCLVFIETQFEDLARKLTPEKLQDVLNKTMRKMSPAAIEIAKKLLPPPVASPHR